MYIKVAAVARTLTIHFTLVGEDDFPPTTRWVDGQGLLKALFDVGAPHALGIVGEVFLGVIVGGGRTAAIGGGRGGRGVLLCRV